MRAHEHLPAGLWDEDRQVDAVLLDLDSRHRRRIRLPTVSGASVLIDLPATVRLREGDGLRLEDGGIVRVRAAPEPLLELTTPTPGALLRLAWHLGNRHLPVQLAPDRLLIREDAVIAAMATGLGATVRPVHAPFEPEGGAYDAPSAGVPPHAHATHTHDRHAHAPHTHDPHTHAAHVHAPHPDHPNVTSLHAGHSHPTHAHPVSSHPAPPRTGHALHTPPDDPPPAGDA